MAILFNKDQAHLITLPNGQFMGRYVQGAAVTAWVKPTADPQVFTSIDITTATTGSWSQDGEAHTIEGSGTDIWTAADSFRFTYLQATGDCTITARVTSLEDTQDHAKACVMMRESLNANSVTVQAVAKPATPQVLAFDARLTTGATTTGGNSTQVTPLPGAPAWLRIVRSGDEFSGYYSLDGSSYTQMGITHTLAMGATIYVGLGVTSHVDGTLATAEFDQVDISTTATGTERRVVQVTTSNSMTNSRMSLSMSAAGFWKASGRRTAGEAANDVISLLPVEPGRVYFLGARYGFSTQTLDLFVDGVLVNSTAVPGWTESTEDIEPMAAAIGAQGNGAGGYFDGVIDDVRIYHTAPDDEFFMNLFVARGRDRAHAYVRWKMREDGSGKQARREIKDAGAAQSDGATDTFIDTYPVYATENLVSAYPRQT